MLGEHAAHFGYLDARFCIFTKKTFPERHRVGLKRLYKAASTAVAKYR